VRNAGIEVAHRFVREGLDQSVKKLDLLTREKEWIVLASEGAMITHPRSLNSRMGYFLCHNFFIRGQNELRWTNANQFELHVNERGDEYLRSLFFCLVDFAFRFMQLFP
jgi:hypothetical protein